MSVGKNKLSRRRKDLIETRGLTSASFDLLIGHTATEGDSIIPFDALVAPTEFTLSGRTNLSFGEILNLNLFKNKTKVMVSTSDRGLLVPSEYIVYSDRIVFRNITANADEDFYIHLIGVTNGTQALLDLVNVNESGVIPNGQTDFNIGKAVSLTNPPLVFRDGIQMFQNTDNSDTTLDGNFYIVPATGSEGSITRFNDAAGVSGANVHVYDRIAQATSNSAYQEIESLSGQMDRVIETVADLAGVPVSDFQAAPNNIDLAHFGKLVASIARGQVGDIRSSMLTEAQFQAQNGTSWVLMDGRGVVGSAYEAITGNSSIPDARGMFLRGKNNGRSDGNEDPSGERALGSYQEDAMQGHIHVAPQITDGAGLGFFATSQQDDATAFGNLNTSTPVSDGVNGTPRTGPETVSKNIAVNHFIKINIE